MVWVSVLNEVVALPGLGVSRALAQTWLRLVGAVVVAAIEALPALLLFALDCLIDQRVKHLFLPAMAFGAIGLQRAPFLVVPDKGAGLPPLAQLLWIVVKEMGLSPEVLPVVRVDALRFVVLTREGAPLRLEVKQVELAVARHLVYQRRLDVVLEVRKAAVVLVLALLMGQRTELGLVLFGVVKALYLVVGERAVRVGAVAYLFAELCTESYSPALVQRAVVEGTHFMVVLGGPRAGLGLEASQVEVVGESWSL